MKLKYVFIILLSLVFILPAFATEPDTIWTREYNSNMSDAIFTPDENYILATDRLIDAYTSDTIWEKPKVDVEPKITKDSKYFLDRDKLYYRLLINPDTNIKTYEKNYDFGDYGTYFVDPDTDTTWSYAYLQNFCFDDSERNIFAVYTATKTDKEVFDGKTYYHYRYCTMLYRIDTLTKSVTHKYPILFRGDTVTFPKPNLRLFNIPNSTMLAVGLHFEGYKEKKIKFFNNTNLNYIKEYSIPDTTRDINFLKFSISNSNRYLLAECVGMNIFDLQNDNLVSNYLGNHDYYPLINDSLCICEKWFGYQDTCEIRIINIFTNQVIYNYPTLDSNSRYMGIYDVSQSKTTFLARVRTKNRVIDKLAKMNINIPTSVQEQSEENPVEIFFPNPADGKINIKLNNSVNDRVALRLFDLNGNLFDDITKNAVIHEKEVEINSTGLRTGTYFLEVMNGRKTSTCKIIIDKK